MTAAGGSPFHLLVKPTGAVCNLDCEYCFFLSKEALYPGSRFRMAEDLLEAYLRQLVEAHAGVPEVVIAWQGGEPTLMGLDFFRRAVAMLDELLEPGQRAIHTMQTNGTKLDDEWATFLREHDVLVGISIDGPRELHDRYRVNKGGAGTFDQVVRGLACLQRAGVEWNVLTTVNAANGDHGLKVYRFLRDGLGARFVQFIPIVERPHVDGVPYGTDVTDRSVGAEQYGRFLIEVFDEWVRRDVGEVYVQLFDVTLANHVGAPPGLCVHSETCGLALALEHTGDVYSCDHFVEPTYLLGNIRDTHLRDLVWSERQQRFGAAKRDALPGACRTCEVRHVCHGGCPKDRFATTADGEPGLNYLCAGLLAFFRHVDEPMRFMATQLRAGRSPAQVMHRPAAE